MRSAPQALTRWLLPRRRALLGLLTFPALGAAAVGSEEPGRMQTEVNSLLAFVEGSGCAFERNGLWYTAREAQAHLRDKFERLQQRGLVHSTEQFIERVATRSAASGLPYQVRCRDGPVITTQQWLSEALERLRAAR